MHRRPLSLPAAPGADRRDAAIVAIATDGRETRARHAQPDRARGAEALVRFIVRGPPPFYLLPALSGIGIGGAAELDTVVRARTCRATVRAGLRVPILYLRTTKARPPTTLRSGLGPHAQCGERRIGDDSLNGVLTHARATGLPVLVTLNGGIWADAYCDVPQWDVNDKLEQDARNCQWNEKNEVMPDDFLKTCRDRRRRPSSRGR